MNLQSVNPNVSDPSMMKLQTIPLCLSALAATLWLNQARALEVQPAAEICPRPSPGGLVEEPEDLRSENGVLKVDFTVRNERRPDGTTRFCYLLPDGAQSPTLRLKPGDLLILRLKNALTDTKPDA